MQPFWRFSNTITPSTQLAKVIQPAPLIVRFIKFTLVALHATPYRETSFQTSPSRFMFPFSLTFYKNSVRLFLTH